jgi:transglutaminase-like putative cysteine protease
MLVVVTASGVALRSVTRSPTVVVLGQLAVGIVVLTMAFARDHAVLGIFPGPAALHDLVQLGNDGMDATRQFSTPAPDLPGLTYLVTLGIFGVALAVDALAVTGGTAVGAGLPLLVLYCVPAAVLPGGASAWSFAAVAGGWLVLLAHDGRLRIDGWGRVLRTGSESRSRRFGDDLEVLGTGARRLGIITVTIAIVVPLLLPSLPNGLIGSSGEGDGSGSGRGGGATAVDPILTLRQNLTARSQAPVLTYTTDQATPPLLRMVADDRFDGETWQSSDGQPSVDNLVRGGLPDPPGLDPTITSTQHTMRVSVGSLSEGYLPVPYPARSVKVDGTWVYAADSLDIVSRGRSTKGLSYTVTYLDVQPTSAQLQTAPEPPSTLVARYTQLPDALSPAVGRLARQLTDKADTEFDKVVALQKYFRDDGGFIYDPNVDTGRTSDAVSTFLASKHGYCVQFASAMAVMARTLGIPARVAVGFLPGTRLANGRQGVSLNDAHAWPELYFEGVGWVRFEPTPAVRTGAPPSYSAPGTSTGGNSQAPATTRTATSRATATRDLPEPAQGAPTGLKSSQGSGFGFAVPAKVWVVLLLVILGLAATPLAAVFARVRRRRSARNEAAQVEAAWAELLQRADDLGIDLPPGSTPRRIQAELVQRAALRAEPAEAMARLVAAVERVRYAPPDAVRSAAAADPTSGQVGHDMEQVVRAVRASRDRSSRLRARVLPRSGTDQLVVLSSRASERIAGVDRRIARTGRSVTRPRDRGHSPRRRRIFGRRAH